MSCLFCDIAAKKIPSNTIYEDDTTLAFLDIHPLAAGHTIVIPKVHAARITDLSELAASALGLTSKRVSDILHASLNPEGFTIGMNDGEGGQQGIPHVHTHVIPRWKADGGSNIHGIIRSNPKQSVEEIAALILRNTNKN